jgi:NADPH:quinone reductase-like Zn-dependent oxidoreductase
MKSVRVIAAKKHFVVEDIDEPPYTEGDAVVRMQAAILVPYMAALPLGEWMTPPMPFTPGQCAVGVVETASRDLKVGQRVYFDAYVGSNNESNPVQDHGFIGCFAVAPGAESALAAHPNGSFAEKIIAPARHFTPIPDEIDLPASVLCRLGWFATALAGLERGGFRPGMTVAVNGATGLVGTSAVLLLMALGARQVLVFGRNRAALDRLVAVDPDVIRPADQQEDKPIDMLLECSSGDDTTVTQVLISRLKRYGRVSFVGALTTALPVDAAALMRNGNTLVGSFWFTPDTLQHLFKLLISGDLDLSSLAPKCFQLHAITEAVSQLQTGSGDFTHIALIP